MSSDYQAAGAYRRLENRTANARATSRFFHAAPLALIVKQRRTNR
jgi:hypothetical protein